MSVFQKETTINAPADRIFAYVADIMHHPEWSPHGLTVELASGTAGSVGSTYNTVGHQMGKVTGVTEITEAVPNEKVVYESKDDVGHFRHVITLTAAGGGVRVTKSMEAIQLRFPYVVMFPIGSRFVAPKALERDLATIKEKMEAA